MSVAIADLTIRKSITVEAPIERAFHVFTERFGAWWPLASHSLGGDNAETAILERRVGGRVYERQRDGTEAYWATVREWEPPHRLVLEWKVNPERTDATEVEVRFTAEGARTRVDLEHRGWERYADAPDAAADYDRGWEVVLGSYAEGVTGVDAQPQQL